MLHSGVRPVALDPDLCTAYFDAAFQQVHENADEYLCSLNGIEIRLLNLFRQHGELSMAGTHLAGGCDVVRLCNLRQTDGNGGVGASRRDAMSRVTL